VKFRTLARWIVAIPLLMLLVLFALSNTELVQLDLFPFGPLPFEVPLSVAILIAMAVGFLLGGLRLWITALHHRRAASRAEETVRLLEARHQALSARSAVPR
jgi:putative membrane protein